MTKLFDEVFSRSVEEYDEVRACVPISISIATGIDLGLVFAILKKNGRTPRDGTVFCVTIDSLEEMGFLTLELNTSETFEEYTSKTLVTLTRELPKKGTYLIITKQHISCFKDGELHDWCKNRKFRVECVFKLIDTTGD